MSKDNKDAKIVDLTVRVKVYPTPSAPYHKKEAEAGESIEVSEMVAAKMISEGWASKAPGEKQQSAAKKSKESDEK